LSPARRGQAPAKSSGDSGLGERAGAVAHREHGTRTQAIIISDHNDEIDHWFTVSYTLQDEQHSANLRHPWLMDKVREGQELTIYADPTNPELIATEDGYATPVWTSAPGALAVLSLLGLFVAVVEGSRSVRRRRRADPRDTP
jgi:hypothetical protein